MGKGEERPTFEEPAPLREPSPPRIPRVRPPEAVPVIPLANGQQPRPSEARPTTPQEAREATEALLREILEEEPAGTSKPPAHASRADSPAGEDWPAELHSLHLPEK